MFLAFSQMQLSSPATVQKAPLKMMGRASCTGGSESGLVGNVPADATGQARHWISRMPSTDYVAGFVSLGREENQARIILRKWGFRTDDGPDGKQPVNPIKINHDPAASLIGHMANNRKLKALCYYEVHGYFLF